MHYAQNTREIKPEHARFEIRFGPHDGEFINLPADSHRAILAHHGEQHIYLRTGDALVLVHLDYIGIGGGE